MKVKSYVNYEMENGEIVTMSSSMAALYKLRQKDKKAYDAAMKYINGMQNTAGGADLDLLDMGYFLYNTYLAANTDNENVMSLEEFIENCNPGMEYNAKTLEEMLMPKKKQNSEPPSEK